MLSPSLFGCRPDNEETEEISLIALNAVAVQLAANHQWEKALSAWRKLLTRQRSRFGSVHEDVATTLNNIGVALSMLDDAPIIEAEMAFEEALWIRKTSFGEEHEDTAEVVHNLGVLQHMDEVSQGLKPEGGLIGGFISSVSKHGLV